MLTNAAQQVFLSIRRPCCQGSELREKRQKGPWYQGHWERRISRMEWSALPNASEKLNRMGTDLTIGFDIMGLMMTFAGAGGVEARL